MTRMVEKRPKCTVGQNRPKSMSQKCPKIALFGIFWKLLAISTQNQPSHETALYFNPHNQHLIADENKYQCYAIIAKIDLPDNQKSPNENASNFEWIRYACQSTKSNYHRNVSDKQLDDWKLKNNCEVIFEMPALIARYSSEFIQGPDTPSIYTKSNQKVFCKFLSNFNDHLCISSNLEHFYFLRDCVKAYIDAETRRQFFDKSQKIQVWMGKNPGSHVGNGSHYGGFNTGFGSFGNGLQYELNRLNHNNVESIDNIQGPADYGRQSLAGDLGDHQNANRFGHLSHNGAQNSVQNGAQNGVQHGVQGKIGHSYPVLGAQYGPNTQHPQNYNLSHQNYPPNYIQPPMTPGISPEAFTIQNDDPRSYTSTLWRLEPTLRILAFSTKIQPPIVDEVLRQLGFKHAKTTIPKWIQRSICDNVDDIYSTILLKLTLFVLSLEDKKEREKKEHEKIDRNFTRNIY